MKNMAKNFPCVNFLLLILMTALATGCSKVIPSIVSGATEETPAQTPTPSETFPPTATPTETPIPTETFTQTPEVEKFDYRGSINIDKIPVLEKYFIGQPNLFGDLTDQAGYSFIYSRGFVGSYRLINEGSGSSLYIGYIFKNSMIGAKIDHVSYDIPGANEEFEIDKLTPAQAFQISTYLNESFTQINKIDRDRPSTFSSYLGLQEGQDAISPQELTNMFNKSLIPSIDNHIQEFVQPENIYPQLFSGESGAVIYLSLIPGPYIIK